MSWRKILIVIAVVSGVAWLIGFGWRWWHGGTLEVTAPDKNYTLRIENEAGQEIASGKTDQLKRRLNRGQYSVFAVSGNGARTKAVSVIPRQTTKVAFAPTSLKSALNIAQIPASQLSIVGENLAFVSPSTQTAMLFTSNSGQAEQFLDDVSGVTDLQFNLNGFGIAKTKNAELYEINDNQPTNIGNTIFSKINSSAQISLGSLSNSYALSSGKDVFIKKPAQIVAEKSFSGNAENPGVAYDGENKLAVFYLPAGYPFTEQEDAKETEIDFAGYKGSGITVVNVDNGNKITLDDKRIVVGAKWSPNGKKLAYALDSNLKIYDIEERSTVATIEKKQIEPMPMAWCSETQLAYADTTGLWIFDLAEESSHLIYKDAFVNGIACNSNVIYFGTFKAPAEGNLYVIPLASQVNDKLIDQLGDSLPHTTNHYGVFSTITSGFKPKILIETYAPTPLEGIDYRAVSGGKTYQELTQQYRQEALDYLEDAGINMNGVDIQFND